MEEKNEMEKRKQIKKIVEDALEKGLVTQATAPDMDEELQEEFKEIMKERLEAEINRAEIAAGIIRDATHLGPFDFIKEYKEKILQHICDGKGHIKEKYRNVVNPLGQKKNRIVLGLIVEAALGVLSPNFQIPSLALCLVLYLIREGLDELCTTCSGQKG